MNMIMQSRLLQVLLLSVITLGTFSCKKNKKLSELSDPTAEQAKMEQEAQEQVPEEPVNEANKQLQPTKITKTLTTEQKLDDYFETISSASSTSAANSEIQEALKMFSTPDAPLLIVFYEADGQASYDEPTTIEKYLNYLKDTGNANAKVEEIVTDSNGKIKEIVLKK